MTSQQVDSYGKTICYDIHVCIKMLNNEDWVYKLRLWPTSLAN